MIIQAVILTAIITGLVGAVIFLAVDNRRQRREKDGKEKERLEAERRRKALEDQANQYALNAAYAQGLEHGRTADELYRRFLADVQSGKARAEFGKKEGA